MLCLLVDRAELPLQTDNIVTDLDRLILLCLDWRGKLELVIIQYTVEDEWRDGVSLVIDGVHHHIIQQGLRIVIMTEAILVGPPWLARLKLYDI